MPGPLERRDRPFFGPNDPRQVIWPDEFPEENPARAPAARVEIGELIPRAAPRSHREAVSTFVVTALGAAGLIASIGVAGRLITNRGSHVQAPPAQVQQSVKLVAPESVEPMPENPVVEQKPAAPRTRTPAARRTPSPAPKPATSDDSIQPEQDAPAPGLDQIVTRPVSFGMPADVRRNSIALSAPPAPPRPEEAIRAVLDAFRRAYARLDAESISAIWPSVNAKALGRAFDQMSEQRLDFDVCSIQATGITGHAYCTGRATYVPRVGSKTARVEPRQWTFGLTKVGSSWVLDSVDAR